MDIIVSTFWQSFRTFVICIVITRAPSSVPCSDELVWAHLLWSRILVQPLYLVACIALPLMVAEPTIHFADAKRQSLLNILHRCYQQQIITQSMGVSYSPVQHYHGSFLLPSSIDYPSQCKNFHIKLPLLFHKQISNQFDQKDIILYWGWLFCLWFAFYLPLRQNSIASLDCFHEILIFKPFSTTDNHISHAHSICRSIASHCCGLTKGSLRSSYLIVRLTLKTLIDIYYLSVTSSSSMSWQL